MEVLAFVLSLFIAAVGAVGVVSPRKLLDLVRCFGSRSGLFVAAGFRVVLGAALFFAAPDSRLPQTVRVLGIVIFVAGLLTPLFGVRRFTKVLDWWSARSSLFTRSLAVVALGFGIFLAWAVMP